MKSSHASVQKLPDAPGVYFFLGNKKRSGRGKGGREILYVGKATSLKDRVKSYFTGNAVASRGPKISRLAFEAVRVDFEQTDSVLEALIREAALIKKHQPPYNTAEKGDTSFNYVVITKEKLPRVFTMRERELRLQARSYKSRRQQVGTPTRASALKATFGPFPHGGQLKEALKIIRKIFPYRGKTDAPTKEAKGYVSRLYEEIGLAPKGGGETDPKEYARTIHHLVLFFEGKKKQLVQSLEKAMHEYARAEEFEKAAEARRQLFALQHINDIALMKRAPEEGVAPYRIESYDIAHTAGTNVVGVMTVVENGEVSKNAYRMFKVNAGENARFVNDTAALAEILERRLGHPEWPFPRLIVVDGGVAQKSAAEKTLAAFGMKIPVVSVVKNERHRPERILGDQKIVSEHAHGIVLANSESHRFAIAYHRKKRNL